MTDFLTQAMKRAAEQPGFSPPPDPATIVSRAARLHHRVLFTAVAAAAVIATAGLTVSALGGTDLGSGVDPSGSGLISNQDAPDPTELQLDCGPTGSREAATFEILTDGYPDPSAAVARQLGPGEKGSVHEVDPDTVQVALLRADGTTRAVITVKRKSTGWLPYTVSGCAGEVFSAK